MPRRGRRLRPRTDSMTIWSSTQVVHWVRREAAAVLGLPEARIRCLALDVGGGFGVKGHVYPEDLLIPFLARTIGRPVQLDRGPPRASDVLLPFARPDPRRRGRVRRRRAASSRCATGSSVDCGAWNPIGAGIVYNTAAHLPGPYKIEALRHRGQHRRDQQGAERAVSRRRPARSRASRWSAAST